MRQAGADGDRIDQKTADRRKRHTPCQHLAAAEPEDGRDAAESEKRHQAAKPGSEQRQAQRRLQGALHGALVPFDLIRLADKTLDYPHPLQSLLDRHRCICQFVLNAGAETLQPAPKDSGNGNNADRQRQHEPHQSRVEQEHNDDRTDQRDDARQKLGDIVRQNSAHLRHIAGDARHKFTDASVGEETQRQRVQMTIQLDAHIENDPLTDDVEDVSLEECQKCLEEEERNQRKRQIRQQRLIALLEHRFQELDDDERESEVDGACACQRQQRACHVPLIRLQVG